MLTGYFFATSCAKAASAAAPVTMSLTPGPDRYSAPPVETWTMPSLSASANPRIAAFNVCDDVTLMAGYPEGRAFAVASIPAQAPGVASGVVRSLRGCPAWHPEGPYRA